MLFDEGFPQHGQAGGTVTKQAEAEHEGVRIERRNGRLVGLDTGPVDGIVTVHDQMMAGGGRRSVVAVTRRRHVRHRGCEDMGAGMYQLEGRLGAPVEDDAVGAGRVGALRCLRLGMRRKRA